MRKCSLIFVDANLAFKFIVFILSAVERITKKLGLNCKGIKENIVKAPIK